jgi:RNA chaperone Hfq
MQERRIQQGHHSEQKPAYSGPKKPMTLGKPKKPNQRQFDSHEYHLLNSRRNGTSITVEMMSGRKIVGVVTDFDRYSFVLKSGNLTEAIFKHAVASFSFQ